MTGLARPLAVLSLLLLAGCSSLFAGGRTKLLNPPPPGISYRLDPGEEASSTDRKAHEYCARYGKTAKRGGTSQAGDSTIVQYSCS
jgi:hypothetical protein